MLPHHLLLSTRRLLVHKIDPLFRLIFYFMSAPLVNLSIQLYFFSAPGEWVPATPLTPQGKTGAEKIYLTQKNINVGCN
jgi:hypothetical protein